MLQTQKYEKVLTQNHEDNAKYGAFNKSSPLVTHRWSCTVLWGLMSGAGMGSGSQAGST